MKRPWSFSSLEEAEAAAAPALATTDAETEAPAAAAMAVATATFPFYNATAAAPVTAPRDAATASATTSTRNRQNERRSKPAAAAAAAAAALAPPRGKRRLTLDERQGILQLMLQHSEYNEKTGEDQLKKGAAVMIAELFHVGRSTVTDLWKRALETRKEHPLGLADVSSRIDRSGAKPKMSREEFEAKVEALPLEHRTTMSDIARHLGMGKNMAIRYAKQYLVKICLDDEED